MRRPNPTRQLAEAVRLLREVAALKPGFAYRVGAFLSTLPPSTCSECSRPLPPRRVGHPRASCGPKCARKRKVRLREAREAREQGGAR